jgi:hypothetical protein
MRESGQSQLFVVCLQIGRGKLTSRAFGVALHLLNNARAEWRGLHTILQSLRGRTLLASYAFL